ncbi:MAG: hypothetical protein QOI77_3321 [Blastocatellia bacterium]|nr:hypothetical protein [Blastocatellia bacterium]
MRTHQTVLPQGFRLVCLLLCVVSTCAGATLRGKSDSGRNRLKFVAVKPGNAGTIDAAGHGFTWNIADKGLPLLGLPNNGLSAGLDRLLSYPLAQSNFPIFQALNYDEEHARYLLPSLSSESQGVHFIEFSLSEIKNTYTSADDANIRLIDNDSLKVVRTGDGTRYLFVRYPDGEFRCASIKDPNGGSLNLLYTANGLLLHGVVDSAGRTITFNYASNGIKSLTQTWMANSEGLTKTWMVGEQPESAVNSELKYSHAFVSLFTKALPSNAIVRQYTAAMAASDKALAAIFGGPNAVAGANGFEPAGLAAAYPFYRGDIVGDDGIERRGHLSYAMHLYGSPDGTGDSPLYIPPGFTQHSNEPSPTDAAVIFYYPRLGNLTDVTLAVFHVTDFQLTDEGNRVRIGMLGGPGGSSASYKHSHIEFYRGNTGLPPVAARASLRIDPTTVFSVVGDRLAK